jgi:YfiH family protein
VTLHDPSPVRPRTILEAAADSFPALVNREWTSAFPWLVQGTTSRGEHDTPLDFGPFTGATSPELVRANWVELLRTTGMRTAVHARQVHGRRVTVHGRGAVGLRVTDACDAHVTGEPGVLLAVTIADCVPVFLVDSGRRTVGVAHAGWRGVAAGVLEEALGALTADPGAGFEDVHVHLGPAICGRCYEVGPEVFEALRQPAPPAPRPIDLRAVLADRAVRAGVASSRITVSEHCTRCTGSGLFSHRGGDRQRQIGFVGIRP